MKTSRPSFPNQNQADGSKYTVQQQVLLTNPSIPNVGTPSNNATANHFPCLSYSHNNPSINSQSLVPIPQFPVPFNGSSAQLSAFNGNATAFPNLHFGHVTSHHLPTQNGHLFSPPMVLSNPQNLTKLSGQFYSQNALQNVNSIAACQQHEILYNFPQNFNQTMPSLPHGHLFAHNNPQVTNQPRPLQPHGCANMPGGQCGTHNQPVNQFSSLPDGQFLQRPIGPQVGAFNRPPLMGYVNQRVPALCYQNLPFPMNPQSSMVNSNQIVQQNTLNQQMLIPCMIGQNVGQDLPTADPNSQMNALPSVNSGPVQKQEAEKNLEPLPFHGLQVNQARNNKSNTNFNQRNHQSKFSNNHNGNEKKKFQKSNPHHLANAKGNFRLSGGKGHYGDRVRKSQLENSAKQSNVENQRSISLNYSEQEIQQWRDERKKNYPSKSNVEKKLVQKITQHGGVNNDDQRRRQQLKEILAKQAELGVEVAEIPPNYLSDSNNELLKKEEKNGMRSDNSRFQNNKGRFQNKHGKRRKHGKVNGFVKKQKFGDNGSLPQHTSNKRKPTLLQKLLSTDAKRDKIYLLQVFRFMVTNSFFKHWPEKPLEFPQVTVKEDVGYGAKSVEGKQSKCLGSGGISEIGEAPMSEACEDVKDHSVAIVYGHIGEIDSIKDEMDDSGGEEGEITD